MQMKERELITVYLIHTAVGSYRDTARIKLHVWQTDKGILSVLPKQHSDNENLGQVSYYSNHVIILKK